MLLDEPTRGMDRAHKDALAARIAALAAAGAAVVVATHDTEFAAAFAERVVLLGQGVVIADGSPREVLGGGRHFSTEVARITGGAALLPEQGAALIARRRGAGAVSWQAASFARARRSPSWRASRWYEREQPAGAHRRAGRRAGRAGGGRPARLRRDPEREADHRHRAVRRLRARRGARASRSARSPRSSRTSSSRRARGPRGRWSAGALSAWAAPCSPGCCAGASPAACCSRPSAGSRASPSAPGWTSTSSRSPPGRTSTPTWRCPATSLPYNLAHAIGNVVFCLLIGPAFIRALRRYRRRFEVRWPARRRGRRDAGCSLVLLAAGAAAPRRPSAPSATSLSAQNPDGGFGAAHGPGLEPRSTAAGPALGLAAAGATRATCAAAAGARSPPTPGATAARSRDMGEVERTILRAERGRALAARLRRPRPRRGDRSPSAAANGSIAGYVSYTAFGVLALRVGGRARPARTTVALARGAQNADGGFGLRARSRATAT